MRVKWLVGLLVLATWLWIFRGPIFQGEVCALRDAGNFYYPLFSWECSEWSVARVPLWNPYDGLGTPALADATSSVLYPGKIVFSLPLPFDLRFTFYVAGHILFAAGSVYFVTRRWGASELGAGIGALSYAFGGYVLFQHCNPVFVVSAAWLPLAIWLTDDMLRKRSPRRAAGLGLVLALMTLGGDPQTAYHAGMMATVYAVLLWRQERDGVGTLFCDAARTRPNSENPSQKGVPTSSPWSPLLTARPTLLGLAAICGFAVAAVQVLPTVEWFRRSDRMRFDVPRSVYEVIGLMGSRKQAVPGNQTVARAASEGLFAAPHPGTHAARTYYYSVGPWRLPEVLWPNLAGRMYPLHQRWLSSFPSEGRVWTPTLYVGLFPLIAAMTAAIAGWRCVRDRWLIWLVVVGVLGSFGWYGPGWILHEIRVAIGGDGSVRPWLGQPVGGLYWFFATLLPGYAYFRYPAKWFVVASLGCSMLAARGADRLLAGDFRSLRLLRWLSLLSLVFASLVLVGRGYLLSKFRGVSASDLYGPFNPEGAWFDVFAGLLLVAVEAGVLWFAIRAKIGRKRFPLAGSLLLVTAVDLVIANQWLIATVPGTVLERKSQAASQVLPSPGSENAVLSPRILHWQNPWPTPLRWKEQSNPQRLAEIVAWERDVLLHRYPLAFRITALDAPTTIQSAEWLDILKELRQDPAAYARRWERNDSNRLPLEYWVTPANGGEADGKFVVERQEKNVRRAWLAAPIHSLADIEKTLDATLEILEFGPQRLLFKTDLQSPASLVLSDTFDANWKASTRARNVAIAESRRPLNVRKVSVLTIVDLPAGNQIVEFEYRPRMFIWGAIITSVSLIAIVGSFSYRRLKGSFDRNPKR